MQGAETLCYMQGVNKVRALSLRADGSHVIFPKPPCCCNKEPPRPSPAPLTQPPPSTKGSTTIFFSPPRNSVVGYQLPPRAGAHWLMRVLEYSMRHLTLGCDRLEPVQLCKWAPGGACWPDSGARNEVGGALRTESDRGTKGRHLCHCFSYNLKYPHRGHAFFLHDTSSQDC